MIINKNKRWVIFIIGGLIFANVIVYLAVFDLSKQRQLEVDFFYVGQGDSIFIEAPNKNQILIDGGPSAEVIKKLSKEMSFYDRTIDLVVLTHPDYDHISGLLEVLRRYKVISI